MGVRFLKRGLIVLILWPFFSACGELDTLLPSAGTYQVKALVNDTSLENCSLIGAGDAVYPYFAGSVTSDPDITGLMVFLRNFQGETLGKKTLYTLKPDENKDFETEGVQADDDDDGAASGKKTGSGNTLVPVKRLDKDLPAFSLPDDLKAGQYTLVFQVLGKKETLYQTESEFYYLGDAAFALKEVQVYLPGDSGGSRLVQPAVMVMLEASLDFDKGMDPYIIWYNGKKVINEGRFAEGVGCFLWKVPEQTGFQSVRAEVFPFQPQRGMAGISREISIPVSVKAAGTELVSGDSPDLLHWYQFGGNLRDSKPPQSAAWNLTPAGGESFHWSPAAYSYGLAAGADDVYLFPAVSFLREGVGGGRFLLRFKPVSGGRIFSAHFTPASHGEANNARTLEMNLDLSGEAFVLGLGVLGEVIEEISVPADLVSGACVTAAIDFSIFSDRFEVTFNPAYSVASEGPASLLDGSPADQAQTQTAAVRLPAPLSGECNIALGASFAAPEKENDTGAEAVQDDERAEAAIQDKIGQPAGTTAVWDEFAIFSAPPFLAKGSNMVSVISGFFGGKEGNHAGGLNAGWF
jgi:hypothetical protein